MEASEDEPLLLLLLDDEEKGSFASSRSDGRVENARRAAMPAAVSLHVGLRLAHLVVPEFNSCLCRWAAAAPARGGLEGMLITCCFALL